MHNASSIKQLLQTSFLVKKYSLSMAHSSELFKLMKNLILSLLLFSAYGQTYAQTEKKRAT